MTAPDDRPRIASARTLLFVPGHRPDRFAKAAAAGADGIVLDLEDAVAPDSKDAARDHVLAWLSDGGTGTVRINGPATPWYDRDGPPLPNTRAR
ncbi:aldolase/citrate lyase family protein [Streptomyces galilaeus]